MSWILFSTVLSSKGAWTYLNHSYVFLLRKNKGGEALPQILQLFTWFTEKTISMPHSFYVLGDVRVFLLYS